MKVALKTTLVELGRVTLVLFICIVCLYFITHPGPLGP